MSHQVKVHLVDVKGNIVIPNTSTYTVKKTDNYSFLFKIFDSLSEYAGTKSEVHIVTDFNGFVEHSTVNLESVLDGYDFLHWYYLRCY